MKKEDNWVNLTKLLCVLIVLLGHYNFTDWAGTNWLLYTVKSAVSVMFIYSGYYLCRNKILDEHEKTKEYLGHLGLMVIVWVLLDFFNDVGNSGRTLDAVSEIFQDDMFNFVRLDYGHLWYIQNLFLAVAIMFIFKKKHFRVWEIILLIVLQKCYYWLLICSLASIGIGFILAESEKAFGKKRLITCLCTGVVSAVILCGFSYEWFSIGGVCQEIIIETMRYVLAVSVAEENFLNSAQKFHILKHHSKLWECHKKLSKGMKKIVAIMQKYGRISMCVLGRCTQSRIIAGFSREGTVVT